MGTFTREDMQQQAGIVFHGSIWFQFFFFGHVYISMLPNINVAFQDFVSLIDLLSVDTHDKDNMFETFSSTRQPRAGEVWGLSDILVYIRIYTQLSVNIDPLHKSYIHVNVLFVSCRHMNHCVMHRMNKCWF